GPACQPSGADRLVVCMMGCGRTLCAQPKVHRPRMSMRNFSRYHTASSLARCDSLSGLPWSSFDGRDEHTVGGQAIVCVMIRIIHKGPLLDHNVVKPHCRQETAYSLRAVQSFSIGPIPQQPGSFG